MKSANRAIVTVAAAVCVVWASGVLAAEDVTGDWAFKSKVEARTSTATVTFARNADGTYSGTWVGQRGGESALSDVTFENGKVKFARTTRPQGQERKTTYEGSIEGKKLTGKGKGDFGEFAFEGTLQGEAKTGAEAICGEWKTTITMPAREVVDKLTITKKDGGTLAGKWAGERGENTISDMKLDGGKLTFTRTSKFGEREFSSTFEGTVEGNQIKGAFKSDRGETPVTATRGGAAGGASASVAGKWELTTTTQQGTRTRVLTINADMTGTYQMRDGEVPIKDLKVEGNKMSFRVEASTGDREVKMEFKGEIDGTNLKGEFTTERGTREVTGKKVS